MKLFIFHTAWSPVSYLDHAEDGGRPDNPPTLQDPLHWVGVSCTIGPGSDNEPLTVHHGDTLDTLWLQLGKLVDQRGLVAAWRPDVQIAKMVAHAMQDVTGASMAKVPAKLRQPLNRTFSNTPEHWDVSQIWRQGVEQGTRPCPDIATALYVWELSDLNLPDDFTAGLGADKEVTLRLVMGLGAAVERYYTGINV